MNFIAVVETIAAGLVLAHLTALPAAAQGTSAAEDLRITVGKSVVIDYPTDVSRISTSNPEIVDAVAVSTREVLLHAKGHGVSTVVIWARTGQRTFYNVSVEHNLEPIRRILKDTFPDENIQIQAARDSVSLVGEVHTQAVSDRAAALVGSLAKTVVNHLVVIPAGVEKQIMLKVRFAEMDRNYSKQFAVNLMGLGALNTPGVVTTGQAAPPSVTNLRGTIPGGITGTTTEMNITDVLNIFAFRPDLNLAATVRALQGQGVLQIMAEPNLVTTNGKEASFLVGGEFPVPILQGGANAGAVTVQFREFGIRLTFNPLLTGNGTMKMYVKPEVSSIDIANSVTFNGFRIPALSTRRMETNIELAPGQSFVIGGLLDNRLDESIARIPGLSSIPILGQIFKSRIENKSKTELVILVTPEVVNPLNPTEAKPELNWQKEFMEPSIRPTSAPRWSDARKTVTASRKKGSKPGTAGEGNSSPAATLPLEAPAKPAAQVAEQQAVETAAVGPEPTGSTLQK